MKIRLLSIVLLIFSVLQAQEHFPEEKGSPWNISINMGGSLSKGNTDVLQLQGGGNIAYRIINPWSNLAIDGSLLFGRTSGNTFQEKFHIQPQFNYFFNNKDYCFVHLFWKRDKFAGVIKDMAVIGGLGRELIKKEKFGFKAELGGIYERRITVIPDTLDFPSGFIYTEANWNPNSFLNFMLIAQTTHDFTYWENYQLLFSSSLQSIITQNLSFALNCRAVYYNIPPIPDAEKWDITLIPQLQMNF